MVFKWAVSAFRTFEKAPGCSAGSLPLGCCTDKDAGRELKEFTRGLQQAIERRQRPGGKSSA